MPEKMSPVSADRAVVAIHGLLSLAGSVFFAFVVVYGRVSYLRLRARYASGTPRMLTPHEVDGLRQWGRRDIVGFVVTIAYLVLFSFVGGFRMLPPPLLVAGEIVLVTLVAALLAHHFTVRCPVCGRSLGLQSGLGLPYFCEICRVPFRPGSASALLAQHLAQRAHGSRYTSGHTLLGLPLIAVAMGPDPASGQTHGVAKGILAVGDVAIGGLAVGGITCGVISVGGLVRWPAQRRRAVAGPGRTGWRGARRAGLRRHRNRDGIPGWAGHRVVQPRRPLHRTPSAWHRGDSHSPTVIRRRPLPAHVRAGRNRDETDALAGRGVVEEVRRDAQEQADVGPGRDSMGKTSGGGGGDAPAGDGARLRSDAEAGRHLPRPGARGADARSAPERRDS